MVGCDMLPSTALLTRSQALISVGTERTCRTLFVQKAREGKDDQDSEGPRQSFRTPESSNNIVREVHSQDFEGERQEAMPASRPEDGDALKPGRIVEEAVVVSWVEWW